MLLSESRGAVCSRFTQRQRPVLGSCGASAPGHRSPLASVFGLPHSARRAARGKNTYMYHTHTQNDIWLTFSLSVGAGVRGHRGSHSTGTAGPLHLHWTVRHTHTHTQTMINTNKPHTLVNNNSHLPALWVRTTFLLTRLSCWVDDWTSSWSWNSAVACAGSERPATEGSRLGEAYEATL